MAGMLTHEVGELEQRIAHTWTRLCYVYDSYIEYKLFNWETTLVNCVFWQYFLALLCTPDMYAKWLFLTCRAQNIFFYLGALVLPNSKS